MASKVEELRVKAEKLEHELTNALSLGLRLTLGSDARHKTLVWDIHKLTSTFLQLGRQEGAEQMKAKIRKEAVDEHWGSIGEDVRRLCTIPVSVLDPPEGTTERRDLTWKEYDNLFRGTTSAPASVLAPEKVKP